MFLNYFTYMVPGGRTLKLVNVEIILPNKNDNKKIKLSGFY